MNHVASDPVQEAPAVWVVTCSCGRRIEGTHPNTVTARHAHHVDLQDARAQLEAGVARRDNEED